MVLFLCFSVFLLPPFCFFIRVFGCCECFCVGQYLEALLWLVCACMLCASLCLSVPVIFCLCVSALFVCLFSALFTCSYLTVPREKDKDSTVKQAGIISIQPLGVTGGYSQLLLGVPFNHYGTN